MLGGKSTRPLYARATRLGCALALLLVWGGIWAAVPDAGHAQKQYPEAASAASAASSPLKIMPLGDSITHGYNVSGGYRTELWRLLAGAGQRVDFVGSQQDGPASLPDLQHEGHPGRCIQPLAASVPGWLTTYRPDVVLLLIGTNDLYQYNYPGARNFGCNYDEAALRLGNLIDTITSTSPATRVIVGTLPPQRDGLSEERVQALNAAIPGMVSARAAAGARVSWADIHGVLALGDLADAVHPNAEGYKKIGAAWFEALLRCESGFADVPREHPACPAIATLAAQGVIQGYATSPATFGPDDGVQRAQMAAFLVRALAWQGRTTQPRSFGDTAPLIAELREASLILANACDARGSCVASGYGDGRFGPNDGVTYAQVISFVTRAFQFDPASAWARSDAAHPYAGVPTVHDADVRTYHANAGTIPALPSGVGWNQPAPRAWVARVLVQALGSTR